MKKLFPFLLMLLPVLATGQEVPRHKKPKATEDINILDVTKNNGTRLKYQTEKEQLVEFKKDAALKMWDAETTAQKQAELSKGGWVMLTAHRRTMAGANLKWFTLIVKDANGTEKAREKFMGEGVPDVNHAAGITLYRVIGMAFLQEPLVTGDTLFVVDEIGKTRHEYLVRND